MKTRRAAIVLAAGQGKRMKSELAKALHILSGKPLIDHVIDGYADLGLGKIVVVAGYQGEQVEKHLSETYPDLNIQIAWQRTRLGTGHAVMMARDALADFDGSVLVAACDVPCISPKSLSSLFSLHEQNSAGATCLSAEFADATGYGRIVREGRTDKLLKIVEHRDTTDVEREINEINSGIFVFDSRQMFAALDRVKDDNSQGEYYLTDVIGILREQEIDCFVSLAANPDEVRGINSLEQLRELESLFADSDSAYSARRGQSC